MGLLRLAVIVAATLPRAHSPDKLTRPRSADSTRAAEDGDARVRAVDAADHDEKPIGKAVPVRQHISSGSPFEASIGFSRAVRDVVRTRVFLVDAAHGAAVAKVHGQAFGRTRPATGFIVVKGFLDPRWLVEIEADAVVDG